MNPEQCQRFWLEEQYDFLSYEMKVSWTNKLWKLWITQSLMTSFTEEVFLVFNMKGGSSISEKA